MKTIGLLGGMSWESTADYYRIINNEVKNRLGGLHSAKLIVNSVDFAEIEQLQQQGDWHQAGELLAQAAVSVEKAGADLVILCTNTMHIAAPAIEQAITIPFLHIADATARALVSQQIQTVGLLGTRFTMEKDFYKGRLIDQYGLSVLVPDESDRQRVHDIIFKELCLGVVTEQSKQVFLEIMTRLTEQGAQAIILGCTEIGMLVKQHDTPIKLFDTTIIHAQEAVSAALSSSGKV